MPRLDLRPYKRNIRERARRRRAGMEPEVKRELDRRIMQNVLRLREYAAAETVLIYVSLPSEIDTYAIIERCLADGKRVAVPRCISGSRDMEFHYIGSVEELTPGSFGVPEPDESCPVFDKSASLRSLMLIPAFAADLSGYRLGYGKGYYDRYMSGYEGATAVLCYSEDIVGRLHHGRFDRPAGVVVTEEFIRTVK